MAVALLVCLLLAHLGALGFGGEFEGRAAHKERKAVRDKLPIYNNIRSPDQPPPWSFTTHSPVAGQKHSAALPKHVASFLYTGDSQELRHANCSRRYELTGIPPMSEHPSLQSSLDVLIHATNFLNMILQSNKTREQNLQGDMEWYRALAMSVLEGDANILRAAITFHMDPMSPTPHVFLQATRKDSQVHLQDLSSSAHQLANASIETEWFNTFKGKWRPHLHKRLLSTKTLESSWKKGDGYAADKRHIRWSSPFLECENGNYKPHWAVTLSAAFYGLKPNLVPEFRGVVKVDINLQEVDIDQCSNDGWFSGTHKCQHNSSECIPIKGLGFVLGAYKCVCKPGFYHPNVFSVNSFQRKDAESHFSRGDMSEEVYECLPCREGCSFCTEDAPCYAQEDTYLRVAIISFQAFCMLLDFLSMLLVYHFRKAKSIRASGLVLLETVLFGSILLYFPVVILYFEPSTFRCILLRWVRLLGYATVYGTVTLKLYRVLKVFLSRTAQRIPYMTSCRVIWMLAVILLIVLWFLIAWTSAVCQNMERNISLIVQGQTADHLHFNMCLIDRWDYMMAVAEFVFLLWGVYLCYAVRTVPSAFHEPRYMAVAVHNELIVSTIFHTIRFVLASRLQPDWMLMLFFVHTHLTVTVTIGLLLIPKFSHSSSNPRDDIATEAYEDELDMGRSGSYLNSSINSAWSEHSLDPEDIRDELKKLYAQLEIYKRKKMIANNPHLQKKRCSKKGLGRSIMRRITEIPETMSRQCSKEDKDIVEHGITKNNICAVKKNHQDSTTHIQKSKEEFYKSRVISLKKSHSAYDHLRTPNEDTKSLDAENITPTENSLLDALIGKRVTKKGNDKVDTASTESVPLVCKSASAHNLTVDKKPLHSRTSVLQKSLSVIASAKEKTLGLTAKTQSLEESEKSRKNTEKCKDTSKTNTNLDKCESNDVHQKNGSQTEELRKSPKSGIIKHQLVGQSLTHLDTSTGNSESKEAFDIEEVCPWELYDMSPSLALPEIKVHKHVSIAPSEAEKNDALRNKVKSHSKSKANEASQPAHQKNKNKPEAVMKESLDHAQLMTKGESTKKQHKASVCPGGVAELPKKGSAKKADKEHSIKAEDPKCKASPTPETVYISDWHVNSNNNLQQSVAFPAEVCPWDFATTDCSQVEDKAILHTASALTTPAKTPTSPSKRKAFGLPIKVVHSLGRKEPEKEKRKTKTKGKEIESKDRMIKTDKSKNAEVCLRGNANSLSLSANKGLSNSNELRRDTCKLEDICPWDVISPPLSGVQSTEPTCNRDSKSDSAEKSKLVDICPWDFEDQAGGKQG
ncbi:metabotropic glycine receptor [Ambystoma mexicanum]|uniref:metabotropic glycine receptor n=1 Tax=Ambystoma mexicanum TaxID=8296 RepID=UPI0037E79744